MRGTIHRVLDVSVAGALLVVTSPLLVVAAAAVWLRMGRPVRFRQERAGLHGQSFQPTKLRTMRPGLGRRRPRAGPDR